MAGISCSLMAISSLQAAGWTPIVSISDSNLGLNSQYDPSNNLLVTWIDNSTSSKIVTAAFLSPLGVLSTPQVLGSPRISVISSVNPTTGDAIAGWIGNNSTQTIETAVYSTSTQTWTALPTLYNHHLV